MWRLVFIALFTLCGLSNAYAVLDVTDKLVDKSLGDLDKALSRRSEFIKDRQTQIDILADSMRRVGMSERLLLQIADRYTGFNNDSALHYYAMGLASDECADKLPFRLGRAKLLPLSGFFSSATSIYDSISPADVPADQLALYYDSGRQMYSYMAAFAAADPDNSERYSDRAEQLQTQLLEILPRQSDDYIFNLGEYYYLTGSPGKSRALLERIVDTSTDSRLIARAAHHLSAMAKARGDHNAHIYYLAQSALADINSATREVASLQELGNELYADGQISRSYTYLTEALASAVECGAPFRMIESARTLPIIESANNARIADSRKIVLAILVLLIVALVVLVAVIARLRREMNHMRVLQDNLVQANRAKELYISQFLNLCSIYMDKLNQFCQIANRKIASGKVDDLYRLTKSGKFVEEQSKEFYEVFDNAFLHLYPDFVEKVNELLRPDARIELREGELLNTDLRILAFMRLGIEESPRIAQVLNYSLNTIYTYRNRTKSRAIDRENFEAQVMKIDSAT